MKAAVLYRLNEPLTIESGIELPALRRGQVLVRIAFAGVCQSQLMEARGRRGPDPYLPHLLGHEGSGEVVEVGPEVTRLRPGQRVVLGWIRGAGIDAGPTRYRKAGMTFNAGAVTTFSDYAVVSENRCVPLPEGVPSDVAALFGCAVPTGAGIVINTLKPEPDNTLAIVGIGGIGLSALAATRILPCQTIAVELEDWKLQLAVQLGAWHTINAGREDVRARVMELTGGRGVDYCIEAAGSARTIELAFSLVRAGGGRCVFASHPPAEERLRIDPFDLISGRRIEGSWGGDTVPDRDVPLYSRYYSAGQLPLDMFLHDRYPLEGINDALVDLEARKITRALIEIGHEDR